MNKLLVIVIILLVIGTGVVSNISGNFKKLQDVNGYVTLNNGIVGCWHFDEEIGNIAYDSSGNNNNGTVIGAGWVIGISGNALEFDGVDDYVDFGNPSEVLDFGTGDFTIIYWIYPYSTSGSYIGHVDLDNINPSYKFCTVFHNNKLQVYTNDAHWHDTGRSLDINTWSQVIWVKRDNYLKLYINGLFSGWSMIHIGQVGPVEKMQIGKYAAVYESFDGIMDEVIFYDYGLSDAEIIQLYTPDIVYVDDDFFEITQGWGYDHFDNIQDGIDAVDIGGKVYVNNGTYLEELGANPNPLDYVYISKSLSLIGENKNSTIINCPTKDEGGAVGIRIHDGLINVKISGFTIRGNETDGSIGIYPQWYCQNIIIENCIVHDFDDGMQFFSGCRNITVRDCITYNNNGRGGISFAWGDVSNFEISGCTSYSNAYGIDITGGTNGKIFHNNFINNTVNAVDECGNIWNDTYPSGGNYWSDYWGDDLYSGPNQDIPGSDGIGDIPYEIPCEHGIDYYPLMDPFEIYYVLDIEAPEEVNEEEMFNVVVRSLGGIAIQEVAVEFNDELKFTDSEGRAYFTAPQVEENTYYDIIATKDGYTGDTETILVKDVSVEFEKCLMFGRIKNLSKEGEYVTFKALKVRVIKFSPFQFNTYVSGEEMAILKHYKGLLGAIFGIQYVLAWCDAHIEY